MDVRVDGQPEPRTEDFRGDDGGTPTALAVDSDGNRFVRDAYPGSFDVVTLAVSPTSTTIFSAGDFKRGYWLGNPSGVLLTHFKVLPGAGANTLHIPNNAVKGPFPRVGSAAGYHGTGSTKDIAYITI